MAIAYSNSGSVDGVSSATAVITLTINAGDTVVVEATNNTNEVISNVTDTGGSLYTKQGASATNGALTGELWATAASTALASTSVTVHYATATHSGASAETYTGVADLGNIATPTTGTSAAPSISLATQDLNNFIVAGIGAGPSANTWTAATGNLRTNIAGTATHMESAGVDNTSVTPASVTSSATLSGSEAWVAFAIELRTDISVSHTNMPVFFQG